MFNPAYLYLLVLVTTVVAFTETISLGPAELLTRTEQVICELEVNPQIVAIPSFDSSASTEIAFCWVSLEQLNCNNVK